MRHMISLKEQSADDIRTILKLAAQVKAKRNAGEHIDVLKSKTLVMLFQKTSTRTRLSFEAAMTELGGHAIFLDSKTTQFSLTDFEDEIRAVMRFGHCLMFRAKAVKDVETASKFDQIPVIDACSEKYHPCQALADLLTMSEHSGGLENLKKIAYLGIENNVSNTLMLACAKLGIDISLVCPEVDPDCVDEELFEMANKTGKVKRTLELKDALEGCQYVHTDTWMNMEFFDGGKVKEDKKEEFLARKEKFMPYQVNPKLLTDYCPDSRIMHCMPCHIGYEISKDAVDHPASVIFDQAENRLHIQKAIILWLLGFDSL